MSQPVAPDTIQALGSLERNPDTIPSTINNDEGTSEATDLRAAAATLMVCRTALVKSPAASRSALAKHCASIDPTIAKALQIVGSYTNENGCTSLHEAVMKGDAATVESLLEAGADMGIKDTSGATPLDLATDDACRTLLGNHAAILAALAADPATLVSGAVVHCATLSIRGDFACECAALAHLSLRPVLPLGPTRRTHGNCCLGA